MHLKYFLKPYLNIFYRQQQTVLCNDFSTPTLPYSQPIDTLETYLQCLGTNRYDIMRKFRRGIHEFAPNPGLNQFSASSPFRDYLFRYPVSWELSLAYLGFTQKEYDFLLANPNLPQANALILYGFTSM